MSGFILRRTIVALALALASVSATALDEAAVRQLDAEDSDAKIEAINKLVIAGDATAIPILKAMQDDALSSFNGRLVIVADGKATDVLTGAAVDAPPEALQPVMVNNRLRAAIDGAIAALRLAAPDVSTRRQAVMALRDSASDETLPLIERALERETDPALRRDLEFIKATLTLASPDAAVRLAAVKLLAAYPSSSTKALLVARGAKDASGGYIEPDAGVRAEIDRSVRAVDADLKIYEYLGHAFTGLSLGSVLLLAALGLAITFGLMGVINMAHGELIMIGAYATYGVQTLFRAYWPEYFNAYVLAALPVAFLASALVGIALERGVIRFLYGRPLETLLATWGISLLLIQTVRVLFGAQNVEVENPSWMSGGVAASAELVLPYNRLVIIAFAFLVVFLVWLMLSRTRLGLYVRAVTQNRRMADCMGVPTPRVDMLAFGLGSGIAGLGGVALSQIGNVGPDLGQTYIVDSFMVVVLGGVGQLAGTIIAALGLGEVNKFLEPFAGAVLAKIFILVFIVIFIQKRPQGLFALKGRIAEN
jgi:urea transport system permease protein